MIDQRTTLLRPELAPCEYEGVAVSNVYVRLEYAQSKAPVASIRGAPDIGSVQVSQLLFGERFDILRREGSFAWGQGIRDGYIGWVETAALTTELAEPTHRIVAPRAAVLSRPEIRSPCVGVLGMNALVGVGAPDGAFSSIDGLGWIAMSQLAPIGSDFRRPEEVAPLFLGVPYVWGARDGAGLDCSGLIQQALFAAGRHCPRDADQQAALGVEVAREALGPGDLVTWRGHIGMMLDGDRLIHANAHHMAVAVEPLDIAIARIARSGGGRPIAYRRLDRGPLTR